MLHPWWPPADPVRPVPVLALVSPADGILCLKPVRFVAECFDDVGWPRDWWWVVPPIKFAAAAGLVWSFMRWRAWESLRSP